MHLLFIISSWKLLDINIWSRWIWLFWFSPSAAVEPTRGLALAPELIWGQISGHNVSQYSQRLTPHAGHPFCPAARVCLTLFLNLSARRSRSDGLRAVRCCSMFRSTFKGPPAGLDRHKNRSTPQHYCFSTPWPIWGRAVCLCWHILQFLPVREHKSCQINNAKLIKATCYGDIKWRDN